MIYVDNTEIVFPKGWQNRALNLTNQMLQLGEEDRRKIIAKKQTVWKGLKRELKRISNKKCWYCEGDIRGSYGHVDHYRPKNKVRNEDGIDEPGLGYWWLAFEASNYRLACDICNCEKSDYFPLLPGSTRGTQRTGIAFERPVLLDPTKYSDPELLWFQQDCLVVARDKNPETTSCLRAVKTINKLKLNHEDHVESRIKTLQCFEKLRKNIANVYDAWKADPLTWENDYEHLLDDFFMLIAPGSPSSAFVYACFLGRRDEEWVRHILGELTISL